MRMVEAAGIEPLFPIDTNPMMANDFGSYDIRLFELPCRFDSPGVPSSPLESSPVLEIHFGDAGDFEIVDMSIRQEMSVATGSAHSFCPNETAAVPL